ncbi:hypothetical protein U1Q18_011656, partial [Sarracenia purpurea var. burkii]
VSSRVRKGGGGDLHRISLSNFHGILEDAFVSLLRPRSRVCRERGGVGVREEGRPIPELRRLFFVDFSSSS